MTPEKRQYRTGQIWLYQQPEGLVQIKITSVAKEGFIQYKRRNTASLTELFIYGLPVSEWIDANTFNKNAKALIEEGIP